MGINSLRGNELMDETKQSNKSLEKSFDSNKYSAELANMQRDINKNKEQQLAKSNELTNMLNDSVENDKKENIENLINTEKTRLDRLHQAILKLDVSNKNNEGYKTLEEILNDSNKSTEKKFELMVKIIHNMNDEIDVEHEDNTIEHTQFKCGNRALLFNYIFNNYGEKLGIEKSNICLPYGHCMNIIKMSGQTYLVDGGAGCFNKIDGYTIEEKGSWKCVVLNKPIEHFKGSGTFYPFSSFPYTDNLKTDDLELYTSFNLQGYSYYFTNKLYEAAQKYYHDDSIKDKNGLKRFFDEHLNKQDNPLKEILDEGDPLAIDSRANQIDILNRQIENSLSYDENKEKFNNINEYMKMITENSHDLRPEEREGKEGEDGPLKQFHKADKESMNALNIPKEEVPRIKEALIQSIGDRSIKDISTYILDKFNQYKPKSGEINKDIKIVDDDRLDGILKNFITAVEIKAAQANTQDLMYYLPNYLAPLFPEKKEEREKQKKEMQHQNVL